MRGHGGASDQTPLDQKVRVVPHDLAVLARAGLRLVGVDHEIMRPVADLLGHERPLQPGRKARTAPPALAGGLDLIDQPIPALVQDRLGAVPSAPGARAGEAPVALAVEVAKDAVFISEHRMLVCFVTLTVNEAIPAHWQVHPVFSQHCR